MAPDSRNGLNVGSCVGSKEYSMLCFQLINDENDSSSVSFQGLGPRVEAPPAAIVYTVNSVVVLGNQVLSLYLIAWHG